MYYSQDKPSEIYHLIFEGDPQLPEVNGKKKTLEPKTKIRGRNMVLEPMT